eukprot:TRINITY_DN15387_c0_g2_i1.p2 TRINITY_DN15387_c0_g2~~TRINITY_DN15387_c0_g2_i1.p2  ORF type:complete len:176 (-),score=36.76 TRINITY_DN15387_c0_g2_i1:321-848(-)
MPTVAPITVNLISPPVNVSDPIDERDVQLVQQTFARVAMLGADNVGKILFMKLFKKSPQVFGLFTFKGARTQAEDLKQPLKLWRAGGPATKHAAEVVTTFVTAVGLLSEQHLLVPILKELGARHVGYGVAPAHYEVVGEALIESLELALGPKFTPAVKNAYLKVYKHIEMTMTSA